MTNTPWYHNGLRFQCTGCGGCCTGAPGYVWVTNAEIQALAAAVGIGVEQFEGRYVRSVGVRKSLKEFANGDCVFFDNQRRTCAVYEARPRQCRTWPFWDSNIRSPERWEQVCEYCPGAGKGSVVPLQEIIARLKTIRI